MQERRQSVFEHLAELRLRIIYALAAIVIGVVGAMVYAHRAFTYFLSTAKADAEVILVQNDFSNAFMTEFRMAIIGGLVIAFPFVLYQLIAFVLPALKPHERRLLYIGLPFATALFLAGAAFGWFVVVPITKQFFLSIATSAGVQPQITPSGYINFVLGICMPLGILFELPLVVMILARIGLISAALLRRIRKFAFLGLMVLAAVLSPPDVVSMTIFLVPLYGLYEFSILMAKLVEKKRE